jgi:hypothetical protein
VGLYSIGAIFSQPVLLINMAVQMSFGVLFFQSFYAEKDTNKPRTRKMAVDIYVLYLAGSVILATGLSVFADVLIPFVATPDYAEGALVVPFLVFSYIAAQSYQTMGPGISLAEKTWHWCRRGDADLICGLLADKSKGGSTLFPPGLSFLPNYAVFFAGSLHFGIGGILARVCRMGNKIYGCGNRNHFSIFA